MTEKDIKKLDAILAGFLGTTNRPEVAGIEWEGDTFSIKATNGIVLLTGTRELYQMLEENA